MILSRSEACLTARRIVLQILLDRNSEISYVTIIPAHGQGAFRDRHDTRAGSRWTWSASARRQLQGGFSRERLSGAHTTGAVRVRQKRVVLTPGVCASRLAVVKRPDRARAPINRKTTGAIVHRSPGRARHKPSNHCAGKGRDVRAALYAAVHLSSRNLRTADRGCQPAPGLPCALSLERASRETQGSGVRRRESVEARPAI
jgi:hypothetical protein